MLLRAFAILCSGCFLVWCPSVRGDEAAEKLVLATYKLANEASTATGTVYRRETKEGKTERFLVTAGHVFEGMKGDTFNLVSRTLRDDGLYLRHEIEVPVRQNGEPLWKKHTDQDLAALLLPESVSVESLPLDSLATEERMKEVGVGDAVRLSVFPERSEANPAGLPIQPVDVGILRLPERLAGRQRRGRHSRVAALGQRRPARDRARARDAEHRGYGQGIAIRRAEDAVSSWDLGGASSGLGSRLDRQELAGEGKRNRVRRNEARGKSTQAIVARGEAS